MRFVRCVQASARKETVEVRWWSNLRDTNLWMEQMTTCLDAKKMDEQLSQVVWVDLSVVRSVYWL